MGCGVRHHQTFSSSPFTLHKARMHARIPTPIARTLGSWLLLMAALGAVFLRRSVPGNE